jgi:hypothetical protein
MDSFYVYLIMALSACPEVLFPILQYSNTPTLQHSNTPILQPYIAGERTNNCPRDEYWSFCTILKRRSFRDTAKIHY